MKAAPPHRHHTMTKRVKAQMKTLRKLRTCTPKERKALLTEGGKPLQLCLRECAINILKGNVHLTKAQFKKLKSHKQKLRDLSKKTTSQKKRRLIEQQGGFLPLMLAPIVGAVLGKLLKK